jgi:CheY-like chemotaxis protein
MAARAGCRILVIEDEAMIALVIQATLNKLECIVAGIAHTPAAALAFIREGADCLDVATLDLNPGGESTDGVSAEPVLRGFASIVVTGYGEPRILAPFASAPILSRPVLAEDLAQAPGSLGMANA